MVSSVVQNPLQNGSLLYHFLSMQEVKAKIIFFFNIKKGTAYLNTKLFNHYTSKAGLT